VIPKLATPTPLPDSSQTSIQGTMSKLKLKHSRVNYSKPTSDYQTVPIQTRKNIQEMNQNTLNKSHM
jgi:hypothetical protein